MKTSSTFRSVFKVLALATVVLSGCFTVTDWDVETTEDHTFSLVQDSQQLIEGFDVLIVVDVSRPNLELLADDMGSVNRYVINSGLQDLGEMELIDAETMRIGVITSDLGAGDLPDLNCTPVGDDAELRVEVLQDEDCPTVDGTFLKVDEGGMVTNLTGGVPLPVNQALWCILRQQASRSGCVFRQPMLAAVRALEKGANAGFFRENAALAIIFLANEDDCSTDQPEVLFDPDDQSLGPLHPFRCFEYGVTCDVNDRTTPGVRQNCTSRADSLVLSVDEIYARLGQHHEPTKMVVARVSGPTETVEVIYDQGSGISSLREACAIAGEKAYPSIRLTELADRFHEDGLTESVCEPDLSRLLMEVSGRLAAKAATRCVPRRLVDTDPAVTGMQPGCRVEEVVNPDSASEVRTEVERCDFESLTFPCWDVSESSDCDHDWQMRIYRAVPPESGSIVEATCRVYVEDPAP